MARLQEIARTCAEHVALAYLFGSMAEPAYRYLVGDDVSFDDPLADIDLGVVFGDPSMLDRYYAERLAFLP